MAFISFRFGASESSSKCNKSAAYDLLTGELLCKLVLVPLGERLNCNFIGDKCMYSIITFGSLELPEYCEQTIL